METITYFSILSYALSMFNIGHATKRNFFKKKDYEIQVEYVNHNKTYVTVFRNIETYIIKLMILKVHFNTKMNQNSGYYMINICLK